MYNNNNSGRRNDIVASGTSSRSVTETVNGSHNFVIKGYSLAKGIGVGKHIASETFTVGGYQWAIYFYPDGKNPEDNSAYVSVFIALASDGTDVRALFELTLLDQSPNAKHKVHSHFDRSLESGPYTLKYRGSMWGYKCFFKRAQREASTFLKDDCLKINCTVGAMVSSIDCSKLNTIQVPESDIGPHFGMLLENEEGSDVTFFVDGERFHAHKLVLAARSTAFETEFFNGMEENDHDIVVTDMEPKALLHFIYRDALIEDEELFMSRSSFLPSVSETFAAKLLAAAEKYGLPRLKLMCESVLCKDISIDSVAYILALADRYHATQLKSICLQFSAENLVGVDIERPVLDVSLSPLSGHSATHDVKDILHCERVQVFGISRLKLGSYASSFHITLAPSAAIPERLHNKIQVCFHRNNTLGWCQCEEDEWVSVQKGIWSAVMSPYETRYVDVRINGEISGSVTVALEEDFQQWRLICLAMGLVLLLLTPIVSSWVPFYYSSKMAIGIFLVIIILLFQGMKLLPTGRKISFTLPYTDQCLELGHSFCTIKSILQSFGMSEEMHNPATGLLGDLLFRKKMGVWMLGPLCL